MCSIESIVGRRSTVLSNYSHYTTIEMVLNWETVRDVDEDVRENEELYMALAGDTEDDTDVD